MCGIPIQKSTPLACVHHMSCDAGAGAVRERDSILLFMFFQYISSSSSFFYDIYEKLRLCCGTQLSAGCVQLYTPPFQNIFVCLLLSCDSLSFSLVYWRVQTLEVTMTFLPKFHGCTEQCLTASLQQARTPLNCVLCRQWSSYSTFEITGIFMYTQQHKHL